MQKKIQTRTRSNNSGGTTPVVPNGRPMTDQHGATATGEMTRMSKSQLMSPFWILVWISLTLAVLTWWMFTVRIKKIDHQIELHQTQ